jgi:hypothetical protein
MAHARGLLSSAARKFLPSDIGPSAGYFIAANP